MEVVASKAELAAARSTMSGKVAVVMTMGALHSGHASLLRTARQIADHVIVTIFVNPLQFGVGEDFDRYPRTLEADRALCEAEDAALIFVPNRQTMYPDGDPLVQVDPGPLGDVLEGRSRPGHFSGVLTVVLKLLSLTRPDIAVFGEKDYQQLTLIRSMVADFDIPTMVLGAPTVRESDGLALSSRNRYLSPAERAAALALSRALAVGKAAARGDEPPRAVLAAALKTLSAVPEVELDYLAVTDRRLRILAGAGSAAINDQDSEQDPRSRQGLGTGSGASTSEARAGARLLVAARVGNTRLIDNVDLENP